MTLLSLYNQDQLDDADFIENFVARGAVLQLIVNGLRHIAGGGESEHQILIGMRGMGKTTMLRRVALAIQDEDALRAAFVPLRFREEQYNVLTLDTLWRNCGEALAEWCEENGQEAMAARIDRAVDTREWRNPDKAATGLLAFCRELGRRPVLLIDNLDLILDNLRKDGWALRHVLQREDGPLVVGAATQFPAEFGDRSAPFYEFFHPILLEPLTETELLQCMLALADRRGAVGQPVRDVLNKAPERIRTLYALTGGNPRVLALIYRLLEQAESEKILDDLSALLDQVTPFYKARVEEFHAAQQRAIIDAIALHWDPITSGTLSEVTGIPVTTISAQLIRLRQTGFIQQVDTSGSYSGYQLSERFLNIWYLMRHGTRRAKQRLRWLTIFLARLFNEEELGRMAARADAGGWRAEFCTSVREAYSEVRAGRLSVDGPATLNLVDEPAIADEGRTSQRDPQVAEALKLNAKAIAALEADQLEEAAAIWTSLIERFDASRNRSLQALVAGARVNKGIMLGQLGRRAEEIDAYTEVISRYAEPDLPMQGEQIAMALINRGAALDRLDRCNEALEDFEKVIARFGASNMPALQQQVAMAYVNKGVSLGQLGLREEAIAASEQVILQHEASELPDLQEQVARAWVFKGTMLGILERHEQSLRASEHVVERFGDDDRAAVQEQVARAMNNMGVALDHLGRSDEGIIVYDGVIARYRENPNPSVQAQVARTWLNKAASLIALGRSEEAIVTYSQLIEAFEASANSEARYSVARAQFHLGVALGADERFHEAAKMFQALIATPESADPPLEALLARACYFYGLTLIRMGHEAEAVTALDTAIARFGADYPLQFEDEVIGAWQHKSAMLDALHRRDEELAHYDAIIARFDAVDRPLPREAVARAMLFKAVTLGQVERFEEALASFDELIERFGENDAEQVRRYWAEALGGKARLLFDRWGRYAEAEMLNRRALAIRDDKSNSANLVWTIIAQGRADDARAARDALTAISEEGLALIDAGVELIRDNLGNAFAHLGKALDRGMDEGENPYFEDILWLMRIGADRGHGERMIEWFVESGNHDRYAPIHAALVAYVRGERFLRDLNPEVRGVAERLYEQMSAPRRYRNTEGEGAKRASKKKRGTE